MPLLFFGFMSFGTAWAGILGSMGEQGTFKPLDAFGDAGGNFTHIANDYQNQKLEILLGNWIKARRNRDLMLIPTKFTNNYRTRDLGKGKTINYSGNHEKSPFLCVEASKRKLQTHCINLWSVHWLDWTTSIEELIDSLHVLVKQGKIMYLGGSDTGVGYVSCEHLYPGA